MIANWNYLLANFLALVGVGMALTASTHALLSKRDSKSAMAWIAVSIVLPFAGPVLSLKSPARIRGASSGISFLMWLTSLAICCFLSRSSRPK